MKLNDPKRILFAVATAVLSSVALADTGYLGVYLSGSKVGYSAYSSANVTYNGKRLSRSDSKTLMDMGLLGTPLTVEMLSTTWSGADGRPVKMSYTITSGGRRQVMSAQFGAKAVSIQNDNSGQKTNKSLSLPPGIVVDDPVTLIMQGKIAPGATKTFYVLDPLTLSFLRNQVKFVGKSKAAVQGHTFPANLIEISDPRGVTKVFITMKGDLLKIEAPMGLEMLPVSKAVALAQPGKYAPSADLAFSTSLKTDKPIDDPASLTMMKLKISGANLNSIPSDDFQTVTKEGDGWIVEVHPQKIEAGGGSIADAAAQKPDWTKPSLDMPSDSERFKSLAKQIVGSESNVDKAAESIQGWVNAQMHPNAGIGVLRDATEVLATKEGVCRDYAILTVTLLRAAGIPARLASGIVNWDGSFYYHAWAEAWDGARWIGIDSTVDQPQISAAHVKLGEGNVDTAFTFAFLDHGKIQVLGVSRH